MNNDNLNGAASKPEEVQPMTAIPKWVWLAPAAALAVAILPLYYDYYIFLRWLVAGTATYLAWKEYELNGMMANSYVWIFGVVALLFNPVIPVHLFKALWVLLDLLTIAVFLGHYRLRRLVD